MASIKDLRSRIGTVKNTQQTTRAMKMVSAAKLRRAQEAIQSHRPYAKAIGALIQQVASASEISEGSDEFPLLLKRDVSDESERGRKVLLVLVSSDRGLCGAFNGNIIKTTQRWIAANKTAYSSIKLAFVGRKGYEYFKGKRGFEIGSHYAELSGKVAFSKAKKLADTLTEMYLSGEVDEVKFVYNEFKNAVVQKPMVENFLPLGRSASESEEGKSADGTIFIMRPSQKELLQQLLGKNFSIQAFRVLLESQASEHGSRMSSMENATKNAGEMIKKLTLQYNKQRQAGITKELLEIISGSESQKSAS